MPQGAVATHVSVQLRVPRRAGAVHAGLIEEARGGHQDAQGDEGRAAGSAVRQHVAGGEAPARHLAAPLRDRPPRSRLRRRRDRRALRAFAVRLHRRRGARLLPHRRELGQLQTHLSDAWHVRPSTRARPQRRAPQVPALQLGRHRLGILRIDFVMCNTQGLYCMYLYNDYNVFY